MLRSGLDPLLDWGKQFCDDQFEPCGIARKKRALTSGLRSRQIAWYALSLLSLTAVHGTRYYNEPHLAIGSLSPETLVAPEFATIQDPHATEAKRAQVRSRIPQILEVDQAATLTMQQNLQHSLSQIEQIRQKAGSLPYLSTSILSLTSQIYLRQLLPAEWQRIRQFPSQITPAPTTPTQLATPLSPEARAIRELSRLSADSLLPIFTQVEDAQRRYQQAVTELGKLDPTLSPRLLDLDAGDWLAFGQFAQQVLTRRESIGIPVGLPEGIRQQGIQAQIDGTTPQRWRDLGLQRSLEQDLVRLIDQVLIPNLKVDTLGTKTQVEAAVQAVEPVMIAVNKGELIVRAGQPISSETFMILDHYKLTQRSVNVWGLLGVAGASGLGILVFIGLQRRLIQSFRNRDRLLVLGLCLTVAPLASAFGVQFSSLPAVGLLLSSFYGSRLGLLVVAGSALLLPLVAPFSLTTWLPLVAGSVVACMVAGRIRSREELALLGGGAALTQVICQGVLSLLTGGGLDLVSLALAGGTGLGWSVIALGASPYLERLFDLVTPVRLLELANPNRPLLRRLATEAPGTFQHTLFVATLAERAAQRLGANAELVRTGTLYHDIGKMVQAQYFIENQMGGSNPHLELNDPYRSAEIIKAHISDGLKLARHYQLPMAIRAFIPEHQGTIRIAYFYHQAQEKAADPALPDAPFRYDGPIPQTRETGLVMLADACEAALRSMGTECLSPEASLKAKATALRICQARWQDGQLQDSGLEESELEQVADAFVEVWRQSHHERIPYPKAIEATPPILPTPALTASRS